MTAQSPGATTHGGGRGRGLPTRPGPPVRTSAPSPRRFAAAGAAAAGVAAAVGLAVLAAVTVLLWAVGPHPGQGLSAVPFRAACSWWLLAQHATANGPAGAFSIAPLTLTAGAAVLAVGTTRWAARVAGATEVRGAMAVVVGFTGANLALALCAAGFADGGALAVRPGEAVRSAAVFGGLASAAGAGARTTAWIRLVARLEVLAAPALRGAAVALLVLVGGGAGVVGVSLAVHHQETTALFRAIGGGWSGGIGLVLLSLVFLPNAALWAVAVAAGPGVDLGTRAGFDLFGPRPGALPSFPLLGALPQSAALPAYAFALAALPVVAGVALGWTARPVPPLRGWPTVLLTPLAGAVAVGATTGVLAAPAGGGAGGRLAPLGPRPVLLGLVLAGELAVCAVAVAAARYGRERHHARIAAGAVPARMLPAARRPGAVESLSPAIPAATVLEGEVVDELTAGPVSEEALSEEDDAGEEPAAVVNLEHPGRHPVPEAESEDPKEPDVVESEPAGPELEGPELEDTAEIPVFRDPPD
jgi:hypothetical protein